MQRKSFFLYTILFFLSLPETILVKKYIDNNTTPGKKRYADSKKSIYAPNNENAESRIRVKVCLYPSFSSSSCGNTSFDPQKGHSGL